MTSLCTLRWRTGPQAPGRSPPYHHFSTLPPSSLLSAPRDLPGGSGGLQLATKGVTSGVPRGVPRGLQGGYITPGALTKGGGRRPAP